MPTFPLAAYAYEALPGDVLDGRTVATVTASGNEVVIAFTDGPDVTLGHLDEIRVQRTFA